MRECTVAVESLAELSGTPENAHGFVDCERDKLPAIKCRCGSFGRLPRFLADVMVYRSEVFCLS